MTETDNDMLTFAGLLADPMIRDVMAADGVAVDDVSRLMFRMRATVIARQATVPMGRGGVVHLPWARGPAASASVAPAA